MHIKIDLTAPKSETLLPVPAGICHDPNTQQPLTTTPLKTSPPAPKPKHLYFAYGSNLSPAQMKQRCTANPTQSARPLGIAILPKWRWFICEAGYANVLPPEGLRVGPQDSDLARQVPVSGAEDAVYGVLYEMDPADELILDGYEGVDECAPEADGSGDVGIDVRPREQGEGSYNKWYLDAQLIEWFDGERRDWDSVLKNGKRGEVPVLVYVDEERVMVSPPKEEYIGRMNRAIREAEGLGVPGNWLEEVLRRFIPQD